MNAFHIKPGLLHRGTLNPITPYICVGSTLYPGSSDGKESACKAEDPGSIPGLGRSPGEGNGYPL